MRHTEPKPSLPWRRRGAIVAIGVIGLTNTGCEGGASAPEPEPTTISAEATPTVEPTEATPEGEIDIFTGEVFPAEVQRLLDMSTEEFLALSLPEQAVLQVYKLKNFGYIGGDDVSVVIKGEWEPSHNIDNSLNPVINPATWADSGQVVIDKLNFAYRATSAHYLLNTNSDMDYYDVDVIKKLTGLMYDEPVGEMIEVGDRNSQFIQNKLDAYDTLSGIDTPINYDPYIYVSESKPYQGTNFAGEPTQYIDITATIEQSGKTVVITASIVPRVDENGKDTSYWGVHRTTDVNG